MNRSGVFCLSGFIQFDGMGEKSCDEHHELNSNQNLFSVIPLHFYKYQQSFINIKETDWHQHFLP